MLNHANKKENNMDYKNFCYWLQGFFEMRNGGKITKEQAAMIEEHLGLVFNKVTHKITKIEDIAEEIKPLGPFVPLKSDPPVQIPEEPWPTGPSILDHPFVSRNPLSPTTRVTMGLPLCVPDKNLVTMGSPEADLFYDQDKRIAVTC